MELKDEWIQEDEVYDNPLLKWTLNGLRYFGILLYKSQPWKKLNCFRGVCFTASMLLFNITQYVDLYQVWGNVGDMTANASTTLLFSTTIIRLFHFYWNRTRFNSVIRRADEGTRQILRQANAEEMLIFTGNVKYIKRLTALFWICALVTANSMCLFTLIQFFSASTKDSDRVTILRSWYPAENGMDHFASVYCIQLYIMYVGQLIVPCWHVFMVSLMIYVRMALMVLNHRLENMRGSSLKELSNMDEKRQILLKDGIVECIQMQRELYEYARELEALLKGAVFMDFVVFSVLLCALLFEASVTNSTVQVFIDICYITTMTAILFLYYWHANEIHYQANLLSMSAFKSNWHSYPHSLKRCLLTFICYSIKPLTLKAFFVPMSLDTFIAILRASYSYFTILKQATN
ncbi:odorant receptor 56a-like [Wyeomyia smithii]|uniref:odorant receptor 56a-like n=1 Tax=Wyeomyia smithii TaxID=174621 RepID=UPI002467F75D|nr:odorant receptor 56a-like [Wyeomyia smithii]